MIPHNRPLIKTADIEAVNEVLGSGYIAQGPRVEALECEFSALLGDGYACALSSGTAALAMALHGLGAGKGDRVTVPTYACSALLNAIYFIGAHPVIVDVKEDDFTIGTGNIETDFVIPVNIFGAQSNVFQLVNDGHIVIEDCAQSLGGKLSDTPAARIYSFYATKIITGGQGGLVWSTEDVIDSVKDYREFDRVEEYYPRFNLQMTDIQAAMISSQLTRLNDIRLKRQLLYSAYAGECSELFASGWNMQMGDITMPYRFVLVAPSNEDRDNMHKHMRSNGVATIVPIEQYELLHNYLGLPKNKFPVAEKLVATTISIPLYPDLKDYEIKTICEALRTFH